MREKATLVLVDDEPTFVLQDGTIIDTDQIGYIAHNYGSSPEDSFYDRFTKVDVRFIIDNNIDCEIEMIHNLKEEAKVPKLYKGKVIIHFN